MDKIVLCEYKVVWDNARNQEIYNWVPIDTSSTVVNPIPCEYKPIWNNAINQETYVWVPISN